MLTIWRLIPKFGYRQTSWLAIGLTVFSVALRVPSNLNFLRRYKYIWLTSGLLLTALTLIFGTNPMGVGPQLWLGCCGIYLQPSEPLKLLLVVYLAAYFTDWQHMIFQRTNVEKDDSRDLLSDRKRFLGYVRSYPLKILIPTLVMTGLALLLLLVQRDLGTAIIFIFLYSVMVYVATGWPWVPLASMVTMAAAGFFGYAVFDVIRLRVDAWLNPWLDPAGRSYQIVQSLIAVANGGMLGRGPGIGAPSVVPVAHSDFVFVAIAEETGLMGALGLLVLIGLIAHRGLRIAFFAPDTFRRYLAAGLTTHLVAQSILIIGGNIRLLPLTGVTLPFVSYGGSSLLVSFMELVLLLHIGATAGGQPFINRQKSSIRAATIYPLTALLLLGLLTIACVCGWWAYIRGPDLLTRTDNPRRAIADRFVQRGALLDRYNTVLVESIGLPGDYTRQVTYLDLGVVLGYTHPVYGQ
jgi:cell division protein FtsW (lipid II flippase)